MSADLRSYLLELRSRHGTLTPQVVVDDARRADSPIHTAFEWDDAIAAEQYRLEQARTLIRSLKVSYVSPEGTTEKTRAFVSIQRADVPAREYVPIEEVAQDPALAAIVLRDAERQWRELYTRFRHIREFVALVQADVNTEEGAA